MNTDRAREIRIMAVEHVGQQASESTRDNCQDKLVGLTKRESDYFLEQVYKIGDSYKRRAKRMRAG